jgi:hypothetical protein
LNIIIRKINKILLLARLGNQYVIQKATPRMSKCQNLLMALLITGADEWMRRRKRGKRLKDETLKHYMEISCLETILTESILKIKSLLTYS